MIPLPLIYYAVAFVGGYLFGRHTRHGAQQTAEAMMGRVANLARSGGLEAIGTLEIDGGSPDDVQVKITTRPKQFGGGGGINNVTPITSRLGG